ncbi:MAG: hypothetical protein AAF846_18685 [Chloroflexota bacterium]
MKIRIPDEIRKMKADGLSALEIYVQAYSEHKSNISHYISKLFDIEVDSDEMITIQKQAHKIRYKKYYLLRDKGLKAETVASILYEDGINGIEQMALIKQLFDLTILESKKAVILADGIDALSRHQASIAKALQFMELEENEIKPLFNCAYPEGLSDGLEGNTQIHLLCETLLDDISEKLLKIILNTVFSRHFTNYERVKNKPERATRAEKVKIREKLKACGWDTLREKLIVYEK